MLQRRSLPRYGCILGRVLAASCAFALSALVLSLPVPRASGAAHLPESARLAPEALARQLHAGGYVLVMRHANSPLEPPSASAAEAGNPLHERQLDAQGKASARALGAALHSIGIPIGPIYASPTFRARETIELAGLPSPTITPELGEGARGMARSAEESHAAWLRNAVDRAPPAGSNTLIVTHTPNIRGAFGRTIAADIQGDEILVFHPEPNRAARFLGRITVQTESGTPQQAR